MRALLFPFLFALGACQVINIDLSHVQTDQGYLNSAGDDLGQLYLFDLESDLIEPLFPIPAAKGTVRGKRWTSRRAKDLAGYKIGGDVEKAVKVHIDTEIARGSSLELRNLQQETINESITVLANYIDANRDSQNLDTIWKLREAADPDSSLRLAIIHTTVNADSASAQHDGATKVAGGFKIPFGWGANAEVQLTGLSAEDYQGDQIPALVRYYVFKVGYNAQNNYDFEVRGKAEKDRFVALLRD